MQEIGDYHFFDVTARVAIGERSYQVWAHLSAEHVTSLPSDQVTYAQVVATSPKVVCSLGFMAPGTEPKNRRIFVTAPLSPGKRDWETAVHQWRVDCPIDAVPPAASTNILMADAQDMVKAVLAPSFGCPKSEVEVVFLRSKFLYFSPYGP